MWGLPGGSGSTVQRTLKKLGLSSGSLLEILTSNMTLRGFAPVFVPPQRTTAGVEVPASMLGLAGTGASAVPALRSSAATPVTSSRALPVLAMR